MGENKAEKKSYIIIRSSLGCHESVIVVAKWAIKKGFTSTLGRGRTFLLLHTLLVHIHTSFYRPFPCSDSPDCYCSVL